LDKSNTLWDMVSKSKDLEWATTVFDDYLTELQQYRGCAAAFPQVSS